MLPDSLQDGHFLGLQRVSTFSPHFSQVKTAMSYLPIGLGHPLPEQRRRLEAAPSPQMAILLTL
jgi:hypothetical protein